MAAYISGHDHGHQVMSSDKLTFIVTGNVAKYSLMGRKLDERVPKLEFHFPSSIVLLAECTVGYEILAHLT